MKITGAIPARYKSSRFPGKPLADICGKPMIWWVYQQCKKVSDFDEIYVATDDRKIYDICQALDIKVQYIEVDSASIAVDTPKDLERVRLAMMKGNKGEI